MSFGPKVSHEVAAKLLAGAAVITQPPTHSPHGWQASEAVLLSLATWWLASSVLCHVSLKVA